MERFSVGIHKSTPIYLGIPLCTGTQNVLLYHQEYMEGGEYPTPVYPSVVSLDEGEHLM